MDINYGEIWFAKFPFEEDVNQIKSRPVVVLNVGIIEMLVVKITKADLKDNYYYDVPIMYWREAKLKSESILKISHTLYLPREAFDFKIGDLYEFDLKAIQERFKKFIWSK